MTDTNDYHRARLRRMAEVRFNLGAERRAARRKRWAEQGAAKEMAVEFLAGESIRDIASRRYVAWGRARRLIFAVMTQAEVERRRLTLKAARERKYARERNPDLMPRPAKVPLNGHPSIAAAARAEGVPTNTMWARMYRKSRAKVRSGT